MLVFGLVVEALIIVVVGIRQKHLFDRADSGDHSLPGNGNVGVVGRIGLVGGLPGVDSAAIPVDLAIAEVNRAQGGIVGLPAFRADAKKYQRHVEIIICQLGQFLLQSMLDPVVERSVIARILDVLRARDIHRLPIRTATGVAPKAWYVFVWG